MKYDVRKNSRVHRKYADGQKHVKNCKLESDMRHIAVAHASEQARLFLEFAVDYIPLEYSRHLTSYHPELCTEMIDMSFCKYLEFCSKRKLRGTKRNIGMWKAVSWLIIAALSHKKRYYSFPHGHGYLEAKKHFYKTQHICTF